MIVCIAFSTIEESTCLLYLFSVRDILRSWNFFFLCHNPVEGVDPVRRDMLIELLDINLEWRMHKVSDGQRRRVQICMGLLHPYKVKLCVFVMVFLYVLPLFANTFSLINNDCLIMMDFLATLLFSFIFHIHSISMLVRTLEVSIYDMKLNNVENATTCNCLIY